MASKKECDRCKKLFYLDPKSKEYSENWNGQVMELSAGYSVELCGDCLSQLKGFIESPERWGIK